MTTFSVEPKLYTLQEFESFLRQSPTVQIAPSAIKNITRSREFLEAKIADPEAVIYGINTGFGRMANVRIGPDDLVTLQRNLILSHAVGVGEAFSEEIVRLAILLKVISFGRGHSGVRVDVAHMLVTLLNEGILPIIPNKGSVGASGDLAPLAHLTLPLIGEGDVMFKGKRLPAKDVLGQLGLSPLVLQAKEGLSLINGTQISTAVGLIASIRLNNLMKVADIIGALSVDGLLGSPTPFRSEVQMLKGHRGARTVAENLRNLMDGSTIRESHRIADEKVQDPYSLRCMPQIHGACRDAFGYAFGALVDEANSVSDNPLVLPEYDEVISAGHFHGEPVAMAADFASIAAAEVGSISERRLFALLSGQSGLPPFLTENAGLNSGFMMLQVTAAALTSENKTLAHPAVVDSIPTGADQEDHVPMATWASRKLLMIVENLEHILSIEYLAATQAIDFRIGLEGGKGAMAACGLLRAEVPHLDDDRQMTDDLAAARRIITSGDMVASVEKVISIS